MAGRGPSLLGGEGQERSRPETAEETHLALGQAQLHAAWVKQHFTNFFAITRFFGPGRTSVPSTLEPLGSQLRERKSQETTSPAIMTLYGQNVQKYVDDIRTGLTADFLSIGLKSSKKTATHFKYR